VDTFWEGKGEALKALGRQSEANSAFAKAKELGYQG
jgi:Flp pilus assembly protein TadD